VQNPPTVNRQRIELSYENKGNLRLPTFDRQIDSPSRVVRDSSSTLGRLFQDRQVKAEH
jgi:hypothetical protein